MLSEAARALHGRLRGRGIAVCICGIDGSGKTTLARQLVAQLQGAGLRARHLHVYHWYTNLAAMPFVILYNRWLGHRVLVLDRSIFDNIAHLSLMGERAQRLGRYALAVALLLYPAFDHVFQLVADLEEIQRRRPDTEPSRFARMTAAYNRIAAVARHQRLVSDATLLPAVLAALCGAHAADRDRSSQ